MYQNETINYDFGHFESFNFRFQCPVEHPLTAQDVVDWDHYHDGETEFWPVGDKLEVRLLFGKKRTVTDTDLQQLSGILDELGGDSTENYLAVHFAMTLQGGTFGQMEAEELLLFPPSQFIGDCFEDVRRTAANELFKQYFPELYRAWESAPFDGLILDTDRFLASPYWHVVEVQLESQVAVLVAPR